jgi:BirA family transcriptional regulator, biotin operon repressor / biotin---[acetyl-CoA-carboxylase] ligase
MALEAFFAELARRGSAPVEIWPPGEELEAYGLVAEHGRIVPAGRFDPLEPEQIRQALSRRAADWLRQLDVYPVIGSTNAELMARAGHQPVDGSVCLAELQIDGRGRRGRSWASPFGAQLAVSLGIAIELPAAELGGVSLVTGLAVLDALERFDVAGLALKWPNDVLLVGAKLGGILIELSQQRGTELIIGIGLNVALPEPVRRRLPEDVADLSQLAAPVPRNALAGKVVSSVVDFVTEFQRLGFAPFKPAFDARHFYHGRECQILQGPRRIPGTVAGVTDGGELILETADGPHTFSSGEVSLRARSQPGSSAG